MTDWHIFPVDKPEAGRKFIAVYNDGSGAQLFYAFDGGYLDADGEEYDDVYLGDECGYWAYLPDYVKFWCEERADDPIKLKAAR